MTAARMKWEATTENRKGEKHHFFASSLGTWAVGYDPADLIAKLKREGLPFNLWMVPGPKEANYQIEMYAPQVEGAVWLGFYGAKK